MSGKRISRYGSRGTSAGNTSLLFRGAGNSKFVAEEQRCPEQFLVSSRRDFMQQLNKILNSKPAVIKTVVLPPGVQMNDSRLADAQLLEERAYELEPGSAGIWPEDAPFECDVSARLLPPFWGQSGTAAHYTVYPDNRFDKDIRCGYCENQGVRKAQRPF
ncbi:hypothetical protein GNI_072160 [Gregarina niphandrodes]|uniref:Uncharacterized protein n=1 Tax=Gregarina niphandrodes TaxID=110365 RepID=A0A023B791_GRENI|nr:hypothetical protein GNI_072160 [Gregarina niphandrodes]EZG67072.1 hypothetical protein GNI_072160 [Gregarina niphandrodes]|eukprot:XP_011130349.1 hypothetical protein GNI_072160 [Gregarina niphandrodes]